MSITVSGRVRFESLHAPESEKFRRIFVYLSGHVPTTKKLYASNVIGPQGTFSIAAGLSIAHKYGARSPLDRDRVAIPEQSFLGFDLLGSKFDSDANECSTALDIEQSTDAPQPVVRVGEYDVGCTQLTLSSAYALLREFKTIGTRWSSVAPRLPVTAAFAVRGSYAMGDLVVEDLSITLDRAEFHTGDDDVFVRTGMWRDIELPSVKRARKEAQTRNLLAAAPSERGPMAAQIIYDTYSQWDTQTITLANEQLDAAFQLSDYRTPAVPVLKFIHCPYDKQPREFNLGAMYSMTMPVEASDESFYTECIRVALRRSAVSPAWFIATVRQQIDDVLPTSDTLIEGFALAYALAAQALTVFASGSYYSSDTIAVPDPAMRRSLLFKPSDVYSDIRKLGTDDCEGLAKEVVMELRELVRLRRAGQLKDPLACAYADALRHAVPIMVQGIAKTGDTSRANVKPGKYFRETATKQNEAMATLPIFTMSKKEAAAASASSSIPARRAEKRGPVMSAATYDTEVSATMRERVLDEIRGYTAREPQTIASAHCFVVMDTSAAFYASLAGTSEGRRMLDALDPVLFGKGAIPPWVAKLPQRLIVEGTNYVFPAQCPLGLLYSEGSSERDKIRDFQRARKDAGERLFALHPGLRCVPCVKFGMAWDVSSKQRMTEEKWESASDNFYWLAVAGFVPTACADVPLLEQGRNTQQPTVFREIAFVQPSKHRHGVLLADLLTYCEPDVIAYMPSQIWTPEVSRFCQLQAMNDTPIPPINRSPPESVAQSMARTAAALEQTLLQALPKGGSWVPLRRSLMRQRRQSQQPDVGASRVTQSLPPASDFDHDPARGSRFIFHVKQDAIDSGDAAKLFASVVADTAVGVEDVCVEAIDLGSPSMQTDLRGSGTCVYDICLYLGA